MRLVIFKTSFHLFLSCFLPSFLFFLFFFFLSLFFFLNWHIYKCSFLFLCTCNWHLPQLFLFLGVAEYSCFILHSFFLSSSIIIKKSWKENWKLSSRHYYALSAPAMQSHTEALNEDMLHQQPGLFSADLNVSCRNSRCLALLLCCQHKGGLGQIDAG